MIESDAGDSATSRLIHVSQTLMGNCNGTVLHVVKLRARLVHQTQTQCENTQLQLRLDQPKVALANAERILWLYSRDLANKCDCPAS